ncbi:Prolyl endopeptidase FAP [Acropora cervicornis]|uniref:Prolyl endopeptidase FAP n=1 Tax=Acropora cervicornis TaxID=6130 RepID=A0AAD9UWH0_ACRCE|nr:Prolyl endopeptidase FAP [Acropora cervicornis]
MATQYSVAGADSSEQVRLIKDEEEETNSTTSRLNRKSLGIFLGITGLAIAIIVCTVLLTLYSGKDHLNHLPSGPSSTRTARAESKRKFKFEDIFNGQYSAQGYSCNWVSDDQYITSRAGSGLELVDLTKNESVLLLRESDKERLNFEHYWFSPDRQYILFTKYQKQQYRYSFLAEYHVYNIDTKKIFQLKPGAPDEDPSKIQYATWGQKKNCLVFVYGNDIYYLDSPSSEEVLNSDHALWFSPDSRFLAYIQFNDTSVRWYQFPWYGNRKNAYTSLRKIAYPKPGYSNPTVKVFVVDLVAQKRIELPEPADFMKIDHYVVNVGWLSNKAYVTPLSSGDGSYYITLWPFTQGRQGQFIHLAKFSSHPQGYQTPQALTSGPWEVRKILAFDTVSEIVYFKASQKSPTQSHIYSVNIRTKEVNCWTCNLATLTPGNKCSYYDASFSLKGSWYLLNCRVIPIEYNEDLRERLAKLSRPKVEQYTVRAGSYDLHVKEYRPPNFDVSKKYAVLFSVFGIFLSCRHCHCYHYIFFGMRPLHPVLQDSIIMVADTYGYGFESGYLVSNFDLIVVNLDARGTCCRGERFKHAVYKQIGKAEAEDTIAVAKYVASKPYVDENKIAIWGWSYGGFLTSYVLGQNSNVFKVGMAVAPVTDWRYYDSIYTERYMLTPEENHEGYEISSVLPLANNFKNESFLVVHGTGDDNVHFQNTAQLVAALTKAGVKYQVQFYPDKNHGLSGGGTTDHLYHLLTRFLTEKLSLRS